MTEKKRSSGNETKTELSKNVSKRPNEAKPKKKQRAKRRLFNTLRYQVGVPPTLALILPSLAKASDDIGDNGEIVENSALTQKNTGPQEDTKNSESVFKATSSHEHEDIVAESHNKTDQTHHALPSRHLALHHYPMHAYTSHHILNQSGIKSQDNTHPIGAAPFVVSSEKVEHSHKTNKPDHIHSAPQMSGQSQNVKEDGAVYHGHMKATDVDRDALTYSISNSIDGLSFNSDGSYTFDPSHASYQHLAKGQTEVVQTTVTVTDSARGTHSETLQFQITGTNDVAKITGQFSGTLTEDHNVDSSGLMHVHGKVDVVDVDQGESHTVPEVLQGKFGVLDIDSDGHWHYQVDNSLPAIQQLASGNSITEQIAIHTVDGTSQLIEIVIGGTSDSAIISGIDSGSVKEDLNVVNGSVKTSGDLSISDSDQGQNHFLSQALIGKFGTLAIDANGHWQYEANNQQTALQELAKGSRLRESFTVSSVDGTQHNVDIQIDGTNDLPVMAGQSQSVKEDGAVFHGQMVGTDVDHDLLTYSISNPVDGLTFNPDGSYSFDPSHASYQHLAKGDTQVVTTMVTVTDTAGGSHQEELKFTITGTNDLPVMAGQFQSVKEDGAVFQGQMVGTDVDQDLLTYSISHPVDGLTFNPDGSYTFDPSHASYQHLAKGDTQAVTTTVTVTDTAGGTHSEELKFTIAGTNDLPVMAGQSQSVKEEGAVFHGQMVGTDVDQDLLTYSISNLVDGLTFNPDGSYSFDPSHASYQQLAKGDTQVVTTMVTVTDTAGGSHREELKFTITGTNDLPVMAGQSQSVKEDGAVFHGQMVATDVDQDLLTYSVSHPIDGLTFNSDGSYTFDPKHSSYQHLAKGDTQVVTTTVTVTDTAGGTHSEELKFTITGTNDMPVMAGQSQSVKEDGAVFHGQMVGTDVDHDLLTYTTSNPIDGLTFNPDGSYTFDLSHASYQHLAKGNTQVVTTMVTVTDTAGGSHREQLKFTITGTNDLPVMAGQSQAVKEDGAVFHGQMVGTDVDQDLLTYSISNPVDGLSFNPDGSYTFDPSHASYQHLAKGDTQVVRTTVTVTDTAGGSHQEELKITITGTNDLPKMAGQSQSVKEDGAVFHGQMVATDVDHDLLTYSISNPIDGLTFNPDGSYTFDPSHASYQHLAKDDTQVVTTMVTVTDSAGGSHREELKFTITGTNDLPVMAGQSQPVKEDGAVFHGQMVSTDVDHDLLTYSISHPIDGLTFNPDGSYTFDPSHASYQHIGSGDSEVVKTVVTVTDSAGGQSQQELSFTVHGTNDAPHVSSSVTLPTGDEDKPYLIQASSLLSNVTDVDTNDLAKLTVANLEALKPDSTPAGTITDNHDGTFTFTPEANYNGSVHFYYQVKDAHGGVMLDHASTSLNAVADNAQISYAATDQHNSGVTEDRGYIDTHDKLHFEGKLDIVDPDKGEAEFDINYGPQTYTGIGYDTKLGGHILLMRDGRYVYTIRDHQPQVQSLNEGEVLTDQCVVRAKDGTTFTIEVSIHGTNDAPTLSAQTQSVVEDGSRLTGQMQGQDIDHGATLKYSIAHAVDGLTFNTDGSYSFEPSHTSYQQLKDGEHKVITIPVTVTDEHGASSTQNLTINLQGKGDAAVISGVDTGDVYENQAGQDKSPDYAQPGIGVIGQDALTVTGKLTISDPDTGESVFDPNGGTFSYSGKYGHLMLLSDGRWSYGVAAGTHDWYRGNAKTNVGSAIDQLGLGETLTDTITVHSKDGTTHDIVITIHGDNDAPYVSSEVALHSGKEDVSQTFTKAELLANAVDVDHNDSGLMTVANLLADHGSIRDNHDGTYTYTPELNYHGKVHFSYDINDAHGGSTPTGASFDLASANDASLLAAGQESGTVTEDHLRSGTSGQLWSGWTNLDVTDVDSASEAEIAFIEVNGVQHAVPADFAMSLTANHGYFSTTHSTDGHNKWSYTADNTSSEIQGLKTGQQLQDTMVLITKDGTRIPVTATIQGQDDHVIIDTPDALTAAIGTAVEDIKTTVVGMLQAHDLDTGDQVTFELAGSASSQAGSYGTFYVDRAGHWHYDLDASKVDSLRSGDGKAEAFEIVAISSDGSRATQKVEILVKGTDDAAIITGQSTGSVTEDVHVQGDARHTVFTGGVLNVKDPDVGQRGFHHTLNAHAISDPYGGSLSIDKAGGWIYSVPNGNLQHLAQGETEHVQYQVQTLGGDTHVITVDIVGTNDKPTLTAQTKTVNEDGSLLNGQMQGSDTDHGATLTYSIAQSVDGLIFNADGSYTFDPTHASYNHLIQNQTQTLTIPVTVTDEHGTSTTQNLEIVIIGSNDAAKVSGVDTGDVRENQAGQDMSPDYAQPGMSKISHDALYASGQLSIVDPDTDESKFDTKGGIYSYHGQYGHLLLREDGHWDYKVAAGQTDWLRQGASTTVGTTIDKLGIGETLTDTITIQTKDGTTHDIVITIHGDNDAPYVSGEVQLHSGKEDLPQVITQAELLANSVDVDHNDQGQLSIANLVADHGSILDNQDGTYTFTPDKDYNGQVHFNYDVKDAHSGVTHTGARMTLAPQDDAATIGGKDTGDVTEDHNLASSVSGLAGQLDTYGTLTVTDPDAGQSEFDAKLLANAYHTPLGGRLYINDRGDWGYSIDNSKPAIQQLGQNETLTDTITVHSKDGTTHDIVITIHGDNDAPTVSAEVQLNSGKEDLVQTITKAELLSNAIDVDKNDQGQLSIANLIADHGSVIDNQDGTYTFTPDKDYNGQVHFTYDVKDAHSGVTHTGATMILAPQDDAATIGGKDTGDVTEDHNLASSVSGLAGQLDTYGTLTVTDPDAGQSEFDAKLLANAYHTPLGGRLYINDRGDWGYSIDNSKPAIQQLGQNETLTDTITVHSKDGTTHDIVITIHGDNDAPTVSAEVQLNSGKEDLVQTITKAELLSNAIDVDKNDQGQLSIANLIADHGSVIDNQDGTYTFTPDKDYNGQVHFTYDVKDAHSGVTHTGATMILAPQDDAATIGGKDTGDVTEDHNLASSVSGLAGQLDTYGTLTVTDPDAGQSEFDAKLLANAYHTPLGGRLYINDRGDWGYSIDNSKPAIQQLGQNETLTDTITVHSKDGTTHDIVITIHGDNDAPTVSAEVQLNSGKEDLVQTITKADLLSNAIDVDHNDQGQLTIANLVADHGSILDNQDGTYTFTPDKDYNGQVHFTYDVVDAHGGTTHTGANTTLASVDDKTTISGVDHGTAIEDIGTHMSTNVNIMDAVDWQALQITDVDSPNTQVKVEFAGQQYTWDLGSDLDVTTPYGKFQFHTLVSGPHAGEHSWSYIGDNSNVHVQELKHGESLTESIKLIAADGTEFPITVKVSGTEDGVVIDSKSELGHVVENAQTGASVAGSVMAHDTDLHDSVRWTPTPVGGVSGQYGSFHLSADGQWHYNVDQSKATKLGEGREYWEHFTIEAVSTDGSKVSQNVSVVVHGNNDAPVVSGEVTLPSGKEDSSIHITQAQLIANATDVDSNDRGWLHVQNLTADHGSITANSDGSFTFNPDPNYNGSVHFTYEVADKHGGQSTAHASLTLQSVNDAPVLHITPLTPVTGVLTNTDPDIGDTHHYSVSSSTGRFGNLTLDPDTGDYKYVPSGKVLGMNYHPAGNQYSATDTFEVTVTDKAGSTSTLFMTFDLNGNVTAPAAHGQSPAVSVHVNGQPMVTSVMPNQGSTVAGVTNSVSIDLIAASDSGQSHTDNITNQATPTIAGHTNIPFSLVKLYDGNQVVGSGFSDAQGNYQIAVNALTNGAHNLSAKALDPSSVIPAVSNLLPVTIDTQPPRPSVTVDSISTDNVINASESQGVVTITGSVSGDAEQGDVVTLTVGGHLYSGVVGSSLRYHIDVPGAELAQTTTVRASITSSDVAGNSGTASVDHHFDVDTTVASPSISFESPGPDKLYSKAEIARGAAGTVTATVHAAADAKVGEHLNINGVDHVLDANAIQHGIQLEVAPNTLVKAVMTDEHGNVSSALNVSAGAKPEPIVVTAPSGSHHISANLGVPTLMPSQTPIPTSQHGWKILVGGHYQTSYTSQWGTLSIDPQTGHLSYQEHANVHTGPHGSAQNVGVHEDHFQIALQGSHHDDVVLHVQVSILSHGPGNSGKLTLGSEVLDMKVTPVLPHTSPPPPPPPPKDAYDEPEPDLLNENPHELTIMAELGIEHHKYGDDSPIEKHTAASTYMEQLGIGKQDAHTDNSSANLPDDIDIVFNDADQHDTKFDHHEDASHHGDHSGLEHLQDTGSEHHDVDDPTLPDDPTR